MNELLDNPIWGAPMIARRSEPSLSMANAENDPSIERQLHTFLTGLISRWKPDLIIVVERKGTAILRALKEWEEEPLDWPWVKVISNESIEYVPREKLKGKRILIFDDMMKTGNHIKKLLDQLASREILNTEKDNIKVAVFAVHIDSEPEIKFSLGHLTYSWFYKHLTSTSYQGIHTRIVKMLQQKGSLMLDTEHLEVRLRIHNNFNRFVDALRRKASAFVFHSYERRTNVTVFYENDKAHELPPHLFPDNTNFDDIVKKCRIVQRVGSADEFAIIPICFPSTPCGSLNWPLDQADVDLLGASVWQDDVGRFYGAGLLGALYALGWILKDIAVLNSDDYSLYLPSNPNDIDSKGGYDLQHLHVVFPTLNIDKLTKRISGIEKEAQTKGAELRHHKSELSNSPSDTSEELHQEAIVLLQLIRHILDQRRVLLGWNSPEKDRCHPIGLTLLEILNLGRRMRWASAKTSTLCDILIDQAALSTEIQKLEDENGVCRMTRTFAPAGEVISELVRRYTTQWGLPHGF